MESVNYNNLTWEERKSVREKYIREQAGLCLYCWYPLITDPPSHIKNKKINMKIFPENFMKHPIHLHHNHNTGMTDGAVHAVCNAVLWQYEGK